MNVRTVLSSFAILSLTACGLAGGTPEALEEDTVILGVNYVGITVTDLDAAEALYTEAVEAETVNQDPIPMDGVFADLTGRSSGEVQTRLMRRTNSQFRLMQFPDRPAAVTDLPAVPVEGSGIAHICFQVADETDAYARFLAAGTAAIGDPELVQLRSSNPVRYGYVRDTDAIVTEIEQIDISKLDLPTPPKNLHRMRHVSFATPDLNRLKDFYSVFLGGQEPRHVGRMMKVSGDAIDRVSGLEGSKIEMAWLQLRNLELEIFQYHSHPTNIPDQPRPLDAVGYNMIVFHVSGIEAARARVLDAGGTVITEPSPLDGGTIQFARDPDGNLIGLQTLPEASVFSAANFPDNGT